MLYIVAGNNNEYRDWVFWQTTIHVSETCYVSNADQLRGMSSIEGRFIGTCFDRPDISQIVNHINVIRSRSAKPIIKMESLFHLTANQTTVPNWSQNNIPVANITTTSLGAYLTGTTYNTTMSGTTYDSVIHDELNTSFKVPLSTNTTAIESRSILKVALMYKSYITNTYNATHSTIEYYFNDKDDAVHFANVYNAVAYEYN